MLTEISTSPIDENLPLGTQIGDYVVTGYLGEGGMATIYAGEHPVIGKRVAIKVIRAALCRSLDAIDRFVQEARAANEIGHPNLVDVFNFGSLPDGRSYFVMEWLQGRTLAEVLDGDGPLPMGTAARAACEICDGLHAAHDAGIVHRDLKPQNVFFVDGGRLKLLDFGIAKLVGRPTGKTPTTQPGLTLGTPDYISPEQARGRAVDAAADVYSLGVLLFEMVTGQLPFVADNPADMMAMHLGAEPRKPSAVNPTLPAAFDALVARMLEKDAALRPTIAEVRAALTDILYPPMPELVTPLARRPPRRSVTRGLMLVTAGLCAALTAALVTAGQPLLPSLVAASASPLPGKLAIPAPPAAEEAAVAPHGILVVRPQPAGAVVRIDGTEVPVADGRARRTFDAAGTHRLSVSAAGHRAVELDVNVEPGRWVVVPVRLNPVPRPRPAGVSLAADDFHTIDPWAARP